MASLTSPNPTRPSRSAVITPPSISPDQALLRATRSKCGYVPGMFLGITTVDEFAKALCVPQDSIPLIVPVTDKICRKEGCTFVAIEGNDLYCCAHQKSWYPLTGQRGCSLLGPEFMRFSRKVGNPCDCSTPQCIEAGYFPNQGAIFIPEGGRAVVLNTPGLFDKEQLEKIEKRKDKMLRINPWHFFPEHRAVVEGKWKLLYKRSDCKIFKDLEGKQYNFPPPRNTVKRFLSDEYYASYVRPQDRWRHQGSANEMPQWMRVMIDTDYNAYNHSNATTPTHTTAIAGPKPIRALPAKQPTKAELKRVNKDANTWEARAIQLQKELDDARIEHAKQLSGQKRKFDEMMAKSAEETEALRLRVQELEERVKILEAQIKQMESEINELKQRKGQPLRYKDLYAGGVLADHVRSLTLFHTVEQMDAFLGLLNHTDGSKGSRPVGDGYCENLRQYSKVSWDERGNEVEPSLLNDEDYAAYLKRRIAARKEGAMTMTWKDDFLAWSIYVRAGTTMDFAAAVVGVSNGRMSDIFHEWNNLLDSSLQQMFPAPTRNQMLRAYPRRFIEADGHARCFLLLDATEVFAQKSSNNNVASSTHSDYKKHCTVKFLGACDPIGCAWGACVPDGYPGRISDVVLTYDTKILRQVPLGDYVKVDKGFLVENIAIDEGVYVDRPVKRQKKQVQQSAVDTARQQNSGNTRIIVENVNGGLKADFRYLNGLVPCLQFGCISKIVRIGYLMQNFKKSFIQRRNYA
jgi:hypothetical protein